MGYQRGLNIEKGWLVAKHSLFEQLVTELMITGRHCSCCPGPRRRVFCSPNTLRVLHRGQAGGK
jgi:hypothetical protein